MIHLLTLKCKSSREEIKLAERMASILKDFEARQLEVDEDEQLEVVEEEEEDWDPQYELMDVERQASSGHMRTFSDGTLVSQESEFEECGEREVRLLKAVKLVVPKDDGVIIKSVNVSEGESST
ncbi:unnamed protein product [Heligmosomoides polygyrus]|uniref:Uncharacterized protein n=1 Tax=Heligmosomoides polygyrus TaxID=6339 RepID=A0A183FV45_HELPZ|nr:unnamed protein product [Heligmosomoides polygyrus]